MARRKSIDDIINQSNRIAQALSDRGGESSSIRMRRVNAATNRYRRNIQNARGDAFWQGNIFDETARKYSRNVYMGLNQG